MYHLKSRRVWASRSRLVACMLGVVILALAASAETDTGTSAANETHMEQGAGHARAGDFIEARIAWLRTMASARATGAHANAHVAKSHTRRRRGACMVGAVQGRLHGMEAPPANADPMIEMRGLYFRYPEGDFELSVEALRIGRGERVGVVGPSGSGKTTLLHLAAGIVTPLRGCVTTAGADLAALDDTQRRSFRIRHVGYVFQSFELLDYLSVEANILLPYRVNGSLVLDDEARGRARDLAGEVGLGDKLERFPDQLSQGEQQRAAVCRALVTRPRLVLADEPTGNLDAANKRRVMSLLVDQAAAAGASLVTVTHDTDQLEGFDRVIDGGSFLA